MNQAHELFQETVRDVYSSEQQVLRLLPEMYQKARASRLRESLARNLELTILHVQRIEQVCERLGFSPTGRFCEGTKGIVQETKRNIEEFGDTAVSDICLIADAQKMASYRLCCYTDVLRWMLSLKIDQEIIGLIAASQEDGNTVQAELVVLADEELTPIGPLNRAQLM